MRKQVSRRIHGYRQWLYHQYWMWNCNRNIKRNFGFYEEWVNQLHKNPPDVFLGCDLKSGGVRGHLHAIKAHSALQIQLVPDESAFRSLDHFDVHVWNRFMDFVPEGNPTVHSHVIPYMIRWCQKQQQHGRRWIHTYHLPYFPDHGKTSLEPWQEEINHALIHEACYADIRLSVSKWQCEYLLREHGIETTYLPNGVDVRSCDQADPERFRSRTNIKAPFVLHVSRNDPVKNPVEFVRLAALHPSMCFVLIGPDLNERVMVTEWQTETPPNLIYLGGRSHEEVQDALAACSALVVTSKREGLPTLVLEAMVHGKPIVVTAEAGCLEAIDQGRYGFSYPLGDIRALSQVLMDALSDSDRCGRARHRVLEHYDWRVVAKKLNAIYGGDVIQK